MGEGGKGTGLLERGKTERVYEGGEKRNRFMGEGKNGTGLWGRGKTERVYGGGEKRNRFMGEGRKGTGLWGPPPPILSSHTRRQTDFDTLTLCVSIERTYKVSTNTCNVFCFKYSCSILIDI